MQVSFGNPPVLWTMTGAPGEPVRGSMSIRVGTKFFSFLDVPHGSIPQGTVDLYTGEVEDAEVGIAPSESWIETGTVSVQGNSQSFPFFIHTSRLLPGSRVTGRIDIIAGTTRECAYVEVSTGKPAQSSQEPAVEPGRRTEIAYAENRVMTLIPTGRHGGEGDIFRIKQEPGLCAKVYHPGKDPALAEQKLRVMLARPPCDNNPFSSLAWPCGLLFSDPGCTSCIGFLMPYIDESVYYPCHRVFDPADRDTVFCCGISRVLLAAALNLAGIVASVHQSGHAIGDLRDANILIAPNARVAVIDCDSFQIHDPKTNTVFPTTVGSPEYLPPELALGKRQPSTTDRTEADLFALGILIFRLLMDGFHPYQARGTRLFRASSTRAKIELGIFPYETREKNVEPPECAPPYRRIPPTLQRLFSRCFVAGHTRPGLRPSAAEWKAALKYEFTHMVQCAADADHWFSADLVECPYCEETISSSGQTVFARGSCERAYMEPSPPLLHRPVPAGRAPVSPVGIQEMGIDLTPQNRQSAPQMKPGTPSVPKIRPVQTTETTKHTYVSRPGTTPVPGKSLDKKQKTEPPGGKKPYRQALMEHLSKGTYHEQLDARRDLARSGADVVPLLLKAAREGSVQYRAIRSVIRDIGPPAVPYLVADGRITSTVHGIFITTAIRDLGPDAVPGLMSGIGDAGMEFQIFAASLLRSYGAAVLGPVAASLSTLPLRARMFAAVFLASSGTSAIPFVVPWCRHPDPFVRALGIWAMGTFGGPAVLPVVMSFREDPGEMLTYGSPVMDRIGPAGIPFLFSTLRLADPPVREVITGWIEKLARDAPLALMPFLSDADYLVRSVAVRLLTRSGESVYAEVVQDLTSPDLFRRAAAVQILSSGNEQALSVLAGAFRTGESAMRVAAGRVMVRTGPRCIQTLVSFLSDKRHPVRRDALLSLTTLGGEQVAAALIDALTEEPGATTKARELVTALSGLYQKNPVEVTSHLLATPPGIRLMLIGLVKKTGPPAAPLLTAYLADPDSALRSTAIRAYLETEPDHFRYFLIQAGQSPKIMEILAKLMLAGELGQSASLLIHCMEDSDDRVSRAACSLPGILARKNPRVLLSFRSLLSQVDPDTAERLISDCADSACTDNLIFFGDCVNSLSSSAQKQALHVVFTTDPKSSEIGRFARESLFSDVRNLASGMALPLSLSDSVREDETWFGQAKDLKERMNSWLSKVFR